MKFQNLRDCILATLILLTCMTVTDAQRSISFHSTFSIPPRLPLKQIVDVVTNKRAFAALTRDGSVIAWGNPYFGGRLDAFVSAQTNVTSIFAVGEYQLGAITQDDTMYMWGYKPSPPVTNAKAIFVSKQIESNSEAFAVLRKDGSVVTWGTPDSGGDSSSVSSLLVDVVEIVPNTCAFAALTRNGDVISWGCPRERGSGSGSMYRARGVKSIHPIYNGFLGMPHNGSVVGWGTSDALEHLPKLYLNDIEVTEVLFSSVSIPEVYLMQADGSVVILTRRGILFAGDKFSPPFLLKLSEGVKSIVVSDMDTSNPSDKMYIAVKHDGSTVAWNSYWNTIPSPFEDVLIDSIYPIKKLDDTILSFDNGFVAVTQNSTVISRAHDLSFDSTKYVPHISKLVVSAYGVTVLTHDGDVESWLHTGLGSLTEYVPDTNVKDIRSAYESILYLFNDGSFKVTGRIIPSKTQITRMSIGISKIFSTEDAFAALLTDGTVVAWGSMYSGGDTSLVADKLNNVRMVYPVAVAFAALKYDGTVVLWGNSFVVDEDAALLQSVNSILPINEGYIFGAIIGDRLIFLGYNLYNAGQDLKYDGNVTDAACGKGYASHACAVFHGNDTVTFNVANDRITGVKSLVYSRTHFALLMKNGEVLYENTEEFVNIQSQLVNVTSLYSFISPKRHEEIFGAPLDDSLADSLFVALKHDHTVVLFPESQFGGNYNKITQYLSANTVLSIQTTERHFVAITKHLDGFVDEYVVFNAYDFMVVKDCRCELEVHDEFVLETSFRPTASPTSSPTAPSTPSPTSSPTSSPTLSPTSPTDSQLQESDNNSESLHVGIAVGVAGLIALASAVVVYRKFFLSPHEAGDAILEKSLSSDNPTFKA